MDYLNQTLTITGSEIYYTENDFKYEVMMDWEDGIMSASAAYACQNGGDILEIGFGMGISAGYIQSHSISTHTICENHPQIIPLAQAWAADKPNVTVISSSWYDVRDELGTFDDIFYDTWGVDNANQFFTLLDNLTKTGAKVTWWNNNPEESNIYGIEGVGYELINTTPTTNSYFNHTTYYLPKKSY